MFEEFSHPDTLKRPMLKWLLIVLAGVLVVVVLIVVSRYDKQSGIPTQSQDTAQKEPLFAFDPANPNQEMPVQHLIDQNHSASAKIETVDQNTQTFSFSANIPDLSKFSKDDTVIPRELPIIKKAYQARVTGETSFDDKPFADLKEGDTVIIQTKESLYEADALTATQVKFWDEQKEQLKNALGDPHILFGTVRTMTPGTDAATLILEADIPDKEKLSTMDLSGSYSVPYIKKTFTVMTPSALVPQRAFSGVMLRVKANEDIYDTATITATDIFRLP